MAKTTRTGGRSGPRATLRRTGTSITKALARYRWWEGLFLVIGLTSFIGIMVVLFLPLGNGPERFRPAGPVPPAGSDEFLQTVSAAMTLPVDHAPPIEIINNGDAFLKALLADIDHAKHSIDFMVYIWEDGSFSDAVLAHLEQKLRGGVQVRVVLDAYGAIAAPSEKFSRLKAMGGKVAVFHSLMPLPWTMARDHKRNHRRSIVIDGTIAYTGGIAVADSWLGNARNEREWRDMMFRVHGSMVGRLQGAFADLWAGTTGEVLSGPLFYPPVKDTGTIPYISLASSPSPDLFPMETFMLLSIASARHRIDIVTPYFLADDTIADALIGKAKSGVAVRVLVPNAHNDNQSVRHASQYTYEKFLKAGVRIFEFQPTFIHTKLMMVDDRWSIIGTANMDNRSRKLNEEVVFGISDPRLVSELEANLAADLIRAREVRREDWEKR
ncbi:MAG: hypothetical protein JOZ55_11555, partial [Alphaproteobacteria bacterium]|nr:hypothetical protein [Alphaproteobacteria bacterium]